MNRLEPYQSYKHSGVEWLGEIPAHWEAKRLKYAVTPNPTAAEVRNLCRSLEVSFVPMEAVGEYGGLELTAIKPLAEMYSGYTYFREGDIVIAKITPCFENGKGALATGLVNGIAFGTTELHVLRVGEAVDPGFLFYVSLSDAFRKLGEAEMYGAGGQKRVPDSFIKNLKHPLPPFPEQRAIAGFLDRETTEIDALVTKKERLIELLREKRSALVTRAVTKGLDPDTKMEDSGVEWLGHTPANWDIVRLKNFLIEPLKYGANEPSIHADSHFPRYIRITDIQEDGTLREDTFRSLPEGAAKPYFLVEGDILFARSGATVGKTFQYDPRWGRAAFAGYLIRARLDKRKATSNFVQYFTQSQGYKYWLMNNLIQATIQNVSAERYGTLSIALPAVDEQCIVVQFLDSETAKIAALIAKVRAAIDRLKELRATLISAAVTGKIDVRNEAGPAPEATP